MSLDALKTHEIEREKTQREFTQTSKNAPHHKFAIGSSWNSHNELKPLIEG